MQALLLFIFVFLSFMASGLAVAHYRRVNRGLSGELLRYSRLEAQLRDSEERYRTLFELAPVGCVVWEPGFKVTEWNDQAARIFGWTRDEMVGRNLYDVVLEEKGVKARRALAAIFIDGMSTHVVIPMVTKDGRAITCEWRNAVLRTPDGRPAKIVSVCTDITRQKAQERELAMFRALVEFTEDPPVSVVDPKNGGRFVYVNDATCRHYGMSREELLATGPSGMDLSFDPVQRNHLLKTLTEKKTVRFETGHLTPSGELVPVEVLLNWFEHDGEAFVAYYVRDIRERKALEAQKILYEAEAARRESEQRLIHFAASAPGLMFTTRLGTDGTVSMPYASPAIRDIFGLLPEDVAESIAPIHTVIHPDDREQVASAIEKSALTRSMCNVEFRVVHPEKGDIWVEAQSAPEGQPDGSIVWNGFMVEITRRKQMELQLERSRREFSSLAENLPDNIARWDTEGRYLYINPTHERTLGLPAGDVIGTLIPDTRSYVKAAVPQVVASGKAALFVRQPVTGENGEIRIHDVSLVPEWNREGQVVSVLGIGRDMTDIYRMQDAIAAREREFRILAESLPDNLVYYDRQCRAVYMNPAMARTLSLISIDAGLGKTPVELLPDEDSMGGYEEALRRVMETGVEEVLEISLTGPDGGMRVHQIRFAPAQGESAEITGVLAIGSDITERKKYDEAVERRFDVERQLSALAASMPGFIFTIQVDLDGHTSFSFAGPGVEELFGLRPADIREDAAVLRACYHPDDLSRVLELMQQTERTLEPFRIEIRVIHPEKGLRWVEIRSTPQRQPHGATEWHGLMIDITDRKQTEIRLREQRDFQETLLKAMNEVGMQLMVTENGRLVYVSNRKLAHEFGYTDAELDSGPALMDIIHPDDREWVMDYHLRRLAGEDIPTSYELGLVTRSGERREYETSVAVVPGTNPVRIITVGKDITNRKQYEAALRDRADAEARLSKLAATAPGVVFILRRDAFGGISVPYSAPGIVDIFGLLPDKLVADASAAIERIHPDDLQHFRESLAESVQGYAHWFCECRVQNPATGELWVEIHAMPEPGPDGDMLWYGFIHDITHRKRAQRQFEMVNFALDNVDEAAFMVEGIWIVHANAGATRFLGYDIEELRGRTIFDFIPDFDEVLLEEVLNGLQENGRCVFETRYMNKDGGVFPVEISAVGFCYEGREMRLFLARDISERKRMEQRLRAREEEFRTLVELSPDTIARYDRDCRRIYANPSLGRRLGEQNVMGKTPAESLAFSSSSEQYQEELRAALESGKEGDCRLNWKTADGLELWTDIRLVPECSPDGEVVSVLAIGRDITELMETEQRLKESRILLRKLARRREAEYESERKRLAWEVYDTLGQLLMVQRMDVSLLRARFPDETGSLSSHLEKMLSTTDKAIRVMRDVAYELRPVTLEMGIVFALEWLVEEFRKKTGIPCELLMGDEDIRLDESSINMLFRIVEESLDNIARHAGAAYVEIDLGRQGNEYLLEVRDDGKGFDLNLPMEKSLGLLGIQERVYALGGEMVILSVLGEGTVVEVRFPVQEISEGQLDLWEGP